MSNDNELLRRILNDEPILESADDERNKVLTRFFDGKRNKMMALTGAWIVASILIMIMGEFFLLFAHTPRQAALASFILLAGFGTSILIKLWFAIMDNKISVVKNMKQLQFLMLRQIAANTGDSPAGTALPDIIPHGKGMPFWEGLSTQQVQTAVRIAVCIGTILLGIVSGTVAALVIGQG